MNDRLDRLKKRKVEIGLWLVGCMLGQFLMQPLFAQEINASSAPAGQQRPTAQEQNEKNKRAGLRANSVARPLPATQAAKIQGMRQQQLADDGERKFLYIREIAADNRVEKARRLLVDFLIVFPEHHYAFDAHDMLGDMLARQGRPVEAAYAYRRAFQSAPNQARALDSSLKAGRLLTEMGQYAEARRVYREVIRIRPSSVQSRQAELELRSAPLVDMEGRDLRGMRDAGPQADPESSMDIDPIRRSETITNPVENNAVGSRDQARDPASSTINNNRANHNVDQPGATDRSNTDNSALPDPESDSEAANKPEKIPSPAQKSSNGPLDLMGEGVEDPQVQQK